MANQDREKDMFISIAYVTEDTDEVKRMEAVDQIIANQHLFLLAIVFGGITRHKR